MAKVTDSEPQIQIERAMMGLMNLSSIEEEELKPEIKENVSDSVSSGLKNGVKMSSNISFEFEQGGRITVIDDSTVQEMVDYELSFIHQIGSGSAGSSTEEDFKPEICTKHSDSLSSGFGNGVKTNLDTSIECEQGGRITVNDASTVQENQQMAVSSIEKDELKPEIGGKGTDSLSSVFLNGVKMSSDVSFECEQGGRIIVIEDSNVQEKQEICLNIKEYQEMSAGVMESVIKAQNDAHSVIAHDNFVFLNGMKGNFADDNFVVVEIQENVEKNPKSIYQSQNPVEMSNASRRSEDNWDRFVDINVNQKIGEMKSWESWVVQNGDEMQGKGDEKMKPSLKNNQMPPNHSAYVSKTGNGCERKEIGKGRSGSCSENIKQEMIRKKEKFPKRNEKGVMKKFTKKKWKQNMLSILSEARNACQKKVDGYKRSYSRNELEALRFVNCDEQRQIWKEIYTGLGPVVARELNFAAESRNQLRNGRNGSNGRNTNQHQHVGKQKVNAPILGENSSQNVEHNLEENISGEAHSQNRLNNFEEVNPWDVDGDDYTYVEEEFEDEESFDEYDIIKKPAFCVEGDPDFDSCSPQDGLEYLRRVRVGSCTIPKRESGKA